MVLWPFKLQTTSGNTYHQPYRIPTRILPKAPPTRLGHRTDGAAGRDRLGLLGLDATNRLRGSDLNERTRHQGYPTVGESNDVGFFNSEVASDRTQTRPMVLP